MNLLQTALLILHVLVAVAICGFVLLQHGKGADMGASFGSGASGSLFGATGSANFLSRFTAVCAAVFFVCTLSLAYTSNERTPSRGRSVLDRPAAAASAVVPSGADQVPGTAGGADIGAVTIPVPSPAPAASGAGAIPTK